MDSERSQIRKTFSTLISKDAIWAFKVEAVKAKKNQGEFFEDLIRKNFPEHFKKETA
jgi:hypothetical protein